MDIMIDMQDNSGGFMIINYSKILKDSLKFFLKTIIFAILLTPYLLITFAIGKIFFFFLRYIAPHVVHLHYVNNGILLMSEIIIMIFVGAIAEFVILPILIALLSLILFAIEYLLSELLYFLDDREYIVLNCENPSGIENILCLIEERKLINNIYDFIVENFTKLFRLINKAKESLVKL